MANKGKVYIMGAGPGDLELLTLKGKRAIEEADCVVYDRLINPRILGFAKKDAEMIYLGKGNTEGGVIQDEINRTIVTKALEGKTVARVKGGDPFVFGRGGEEIQSLFDNGISFEVIPGITSSISVPAYAGIPVTHRGIARSFHVFTGHTMEDGTWHNFEAIAKLDGTLVFLMGIKTLPIIVSDLVKNGKDSKTPVAIIEKGATPDQRITVGTLENIVEKTKEKKIIPPAITIIGEVVNLRETFKWFEHKKLFGKKILVTRDKNQAGEFSNKIEKMGGIAIELPFIEIESVLSKVTPEHLKEYSVLLFNSPNGVREFMKKIDDIRSLAHLKIGAVGSKTKELLEEYKIKADFMPKEYMVSNLAELSIEYTKAGEKILIITSDISLCDTDKFNSMYDREFQKIVAYNTKKIIREKKEVCDILNKVEVVTFLSSSTVDAFYASIDGDLECIKNIKFASIGPVTSKTMRKYGFSVDYEAKVYDINGILDALK